MTKKSKQVENRIQSSEHVITAATTHRNQIAENLAARAAKVQGANTPITREIVGAFFDFLVDDLKHSVSTMDDAEMHVVAERSDDIGLREARDSAVSSLIAATVRIRSMVLDALGNTGIETYGLSGETPRVPRDNMNHAMTVAMLLQERPFNVTVEGVTFDSAAMASTLITKANAVDNAMATIQREEQELVDELGKRHGAIVEWSDVHQGVADTLTGLFRLAGRKDLSERVRPTSRTLAGEDVSPPADPPKDPGPTTGG
ncbi:MAG TPA: hypothetical protein PK156_48030 [Polyangium sp.]|nr:hypothetical protein [Polyangium sp.]